MRRTRSRVVLTASLIAGCGAPPSGAGETTLLCEISEPTSSFALYSDEIDPFACDPLAPAPHPAAFQPPVLAGRSDHGETVVVDRLPLAGQTRIFVRTPDALDLVLTDASVYEITSDGTSSFSFFELTGSSIESGVIRIPIQDTGGAGMYDFSSAEISLHYAPVAPGTDGETVLATGEPLQPIEDCDSIRSPDVSGWWGQEYLSETEDGRFLLVVQLLEFSKNPLDPSYFLFFGPPDALVQRELLSFVRDLGGGTRMEFRLENEQAVAVFPASCPEATVGRFCDASLTTETTEEVLVSRASDVPGLLLDLDVFCKFAFTEE